MIKAIERPAVACFVALSVAMICIFIAELVMGLTISKGIDGKQIWSSDYSLVVHVVVIAASVALGIAAAFIFDVERPIDPPPKSARDWFFVALWLGVFLSALLMPLMVLLGLLP